MNDVEIARDRGPLERFRLYSLMEGGILVERAAAPDMGGIGEAIGALNDDARLAGRRLMDDGPIGILDSQGPPGWRWIVLPWRRPVDVPRYTPTGEPLA